MEKARAYNIEVYAGDGELEKLKEVLGKNPSQEDLDIALINAIAYSQLETADALLLLGASFSNYNYQAVYYVVHNDELEGLQYAISKGVDINIQQGMILNESIITAINSKSTVLLEWVLKNNADLKFITKNSLKLVQKYGTNEIKQLLQSVI